MYFFTGSNLFKQWIGCDNNVVDKFTRVYDDKQVYPNFDVKTATLLHSGWSHNIFHFNNQFYIAGDYKGSGEYLEQINLPECVNSCNLTIVSDDYRLVLVSTDSCTFWLVNLENKEVKALHLNTEVPIESDSKRFKKADHIILKCVATNGSLMFITSKNLVYCGFIPNLMDTSNCVGEPIDIQCGNEHYMLLTTSGRIYTWGNGRRLQLGHGDVNILDSPTEVDALAGINIVKISAGGWHSLALSEFGDLYAWGWNDTGQLGIKEGTNKKSLKSYSLPTLVDIFDENGMTINNNIKDIACGSRHSAILLDDDSVWTSGHNKYGQLGHSIPENTTVYHFKKCCSFKFVCGLMCGQWSTVINIMKPYIMIFS